MKIGLVVPIVPILSFSPAVLYAHAKVT